MVVFLTVCTVGCAPTYRYLPSENRIPELAELKQAAAMQPHRSFRVPVRCGKGYTLRIALHETGCGLRDCVVVLLHGVFSDSRLWRFVRGDLGADHDLLAVDLPGAGRSDDPAPALVGPRGYAPKTMARDVLTALRAYLRQRPSTARVTLVGHSLGSAIVLHMFCDANLRRDFADVLGSVDGVVLLAPVDPAARGNFDGTVFDELADLSDVWVRLADLTGVLKERAAVGARESRVDPSRAVREDADWALEILRDRDRRRALQATLRQADPKVQRAPDAMRKGYAELCVPVLVVTGALDEWSTPAAGRALADSLPRSHVRVIPAAKHSFPLERPNTVSQVIREFIAAPVAAHRPRRPNLPTASPDTASTAAGAGVGPPGVKPPD